MCIHIFISDPLLESIRYVKWCTFNTNEHILIMQGWACYFSSFNNEATGAETLNSTHTVTYMAAKQTDLGTRSVCIMHAFLTNECTVVYYRGHLGILSHCRFKHQHSSTFALHRAVHTPEDVWARCFSHSGTFSTICDRSDKIPLAGIQKSDLSKVFVKRRTVMREPKVWTS